MQARLRSAGETRGFAVSRLLTQWPEVVGEDIAAIARPVNVRYGRQGLGATLTLLTRGAHGPQLEMQKDRIRQRVNACYGYNAISKIHITQTAPTGFAEGQAQFAPAPRPGPAAPSPQALAQGREAAKDVRDDRLRAALEQLAANVITKHASNRRP